MFGNEEMEGTLVNWGVKSVIYNWKWGRGRGSRFIVTRINV
jgi:hypothetical protein